MKNIFCEQGIAWARVAAMDATAGQVAAAGGTDPEGDYSVGHLLLRSYRLGARKPGYPPGKTATPGLIEISYTIPTQTTDFLQGRQERLTYVPDVRGSAMFWETGAGRCYLIPALEIPAWCLGQCPMVHGNQRENE